MALEIKKTSSYLPENIISNQHFEKYLDTSEEWISSRTGIKFRHFLEEKGTSYMVEKVCKNFYLSDEERENIKAIIVTTLSSDYAMPNLACFAQSYLNLGTDVFATDINMACSGFAGGMKLIEGLLQDGQYGVLISAEHLSKVIDQNDRSTAVLFGDGAGGVLVKKNNNESFCDFGSKFSKTALSLSITQNKCDYVEMDGKLVYRFAVETISGSITRVLDKLGKTPQDIDYFISHQANEKILKSACKKWNVSMEKFPMNLQNVGNTSSASIPLVLDEINKMGMLKKGDKLIFCGFGGGLTWVSYYLEW